MMDRIVINICYKDRPTELYGLLISLKNQTYQKFDIFILDDQSGTNINQYYFISALIQKLQCEGHFIKILRTEFPHGVSRARQRLVDESLKSDYKLLLRLDDDIILENDYIARLVRVIEKGYDIASGITPLLVPLHRRNVKSVDIIDEFILDGSKILYDGDDCGFEYIGEKIADCHHFRSCALIKREVHEKIKYYPTRLSKHGFREETIFSLKAKMNGFKIGVDLQAKAWHLNTPSGGERFLDSQQLMKHNSEMLQDFIKENVIELNKIFPKKEISNLKRAKETNLARIEI
jgi:GT2 family glycosyltransferase